MTSVTTRLAQLAAVSLVLLVASACVSIPTSSSVQEGRAVGPQNEPIFINTPPDPIAGAEPAAVVQGFFQAMLAYPQTATIARKYLTPAAAAAWNPQDGLVVYAEPSVGQRSKTSVSFAATALGSLDERGSWTSARPAHRQILADLRVKRVDGEWRIENPLPGIYVDRDFFQRGYDPYSLYFFDPTRTVLTPDPVYLVKSDSTATTLVKDLLGGPTSDLAGVAGSAAPSGAQVDVSVSTSATGVAEIPLSADVLSLSADDRQLFAAQLVWTLRQVPGIEAISITVDGIQLSVPNVGAEISVDKYAGYDPAGLAGERRLFAFDKQGLVTVASADAAPVLGPVRAIPPGRSAAIDTSGSLAAIVDPGGRTILVAGVPTGSDDAVSTWFSDGTRLLRPSWDVHTVLWVVDRTTTGSNFYAVTADGARPVRAPGLSDQDVVAFAVSRDGVRLAAIVRSGANTKLVVSMINRNPQDPTRVSLRDAHQILSADVNVRQMTGLAWVGPTSLAVLGSEPNVSLQPYEVAIDGSDTEQASGFLPVRPVRIAAGPNLDAPIAVGALNGEIYVQTADLSWVRFGGTSRLRAPVYPG